MPSRINKNGIIALAFIVVLLAVMGGMYLLRKSDEPPKLERPVTQRTEERPAVEEPTVPTPPVEEQWVETSEGVVVFTEPELKPEPGPEPTTSMPPVTQNGGPEFPESTGTVETPPPVPTLAPISENDTPIEPEQPVAVVQIEPIEQAAAEVRWVPFIYFHQKSRCRCIPDRIVYFFPGLPSQPMPTTASTPIFFPPIMLYRPNVVVRTEMIFPFY